MDLMYQQPDAAIDCGSKGSLPPRIRALYISGVEQTGGWLAHALAADSASEVVLDEVVGAATGLEKLRDEVFDAVLISHDPGELDALELVEAFRAGGSEEPVVILGVESEHELSALAYEAGADAYVCVHSATTRALIWTVARAIQRHALIFENRQLRQAEQHRLQLERNEAQRLLEQQRALIDDLESLRYRASGAGHHAAAGQPTLSKQLTTHFTPPGQLVTHYCELLRAYVIMGAGNMVDEIGSLAKLFSSADISSDQTMQLHLLALEELLRGLGNRSTRHVMNRADMMVLEVVLHLAESYRTRYHRAVTRPRQLHLPGFDLSPDTSRGDEPTD